MKSGIYTITSPSGKQYVGSAVDFGRRWSLHRSQLRSGTHHNRPLQAAWDKYGESNMVFSKIAFCPKEDLVWREQEQIDALQPAYNMCPVAGNIQGIKRSAETRAKHSAAATGERHPMYGKSHSPESRAKMAASRQGKPRAESTRSKMSAAMSGENNPQFGKKLSDDHREALVTSRHRPVMCIETGRRFPSVSAAVAWVREGVNPKATKTAVSLCSKGKQKTAYGFHWEYAM